MNSNNWFKNHPYLTILLAVIVSNCILSLNEPFTSTFIFKWIVGSFVWFIIASTVVFIYKTSVNINEKNALWVKRIPRFTGSNIITYIILSLFTLTIIILSYISILSVLH